MKYRSVIAILVSSAVSSLAQHSSGDHSMKDCPMMTPEHAAGVDARGDKGMGFSHLTTTHHFRMLEDGGAIEVTAKDASDTTSRDQIRMHLAHIAKMFAQGNFDVPMFVHDRMPDGATTMQEMKSKISYQYEETTAGGVVRMKTSDAKALAAIHDFMRFQIREHRTGDPEQVSG